MINEDLYKNLIDKMELAFAFHEIVLNDCGEAVDYKFIYGNPMFFKIIGLDMENTIGKTVLEVFPNTESYWIERYGKVAITGESDYFEDYSKELNQHFYVTAYSPKKNFFAVIINDVTTNKKIEQDLKSKKEYAEQANSYKSQFLADMSHEIRTPLNGLIGMIQLINETDLTEYQKEIIKILQTSSELLMFIINDVLDYSKIEADKIEMERIPFCFKEIVTDSVNLFRVSAEKNSIDLKINIDKNIPFNLNGDPYRLKQIISNIIGNSIKYTNEGEIEIIAKFLGDINEDKLKVLFMIRDTGIGIAADKLSIIFEAFEQSDKSNTRKYGSTGLGLSICKKLVNLMGGDIWVESEEGNGSLFSFTCSFYKTNNKEINNQPIRNLYNIRTEKRKLKILLVEDDLVSSFFIEKLIQKKGWDIHIANNGKEAIEFIDKSDFDLILMDVQMPIMDGFQTSKIIRSKYKLKRIPIIAMTANAMIGDREKCIEQGMDDYLSKPIIISKFYDIIEKWTKEEVH